MKGWWDPTALLATYSRDEDQWAAHRHWMGTGFSPGPIARPGDLRHFDEQASSRAGILGLPSLSRPADHDRAQHVGPTVVQLAPIQYGHEDPGWLDSHLGV